MPISTEGVVAKARAVLADESPTTRWSDEDLLGWANLAQRAILLIRPDASSVIETVALVQGPLQSLPSDFIRLSDVHQNMGVGGATPGDAITLVDRHEMDEIDRSWRTATENGQVEHVVYDGEVPRQFWVYPQQPATAHSIRISGPKVPTDALLQGVGGHTSASTTIGFDDIYEPVFIDYIVARALMTDNEMARSERWKDFMTMFMNQLGAKTTTDTVTDPNAKASPPVAPERHRSGGLFNPV